MAKGGRILALAIILATLVPHEIKSEITIPKQNEIMTGVLDGREVRVVPVILTGYCNCYICTQSGKGITASGIRASRGTVASPSSINFGTKVHIGDDTRIVQDRGGAINVKDGVYHFDLWFPTHKEALAFGVKKGIGLFSNGTIFIRMEE